MSDTLKEILSGFCTAILFAVASLAFGACARGDCVLAFGATWCGPCQQMAPVEAQLRREGYDVRPVDIDKAPDMKRGYMISAVPTFVYVIETPYGCYEGGRIVGKCTAGQLRRLCVMPAVATVGAAARNAVRSVIYCPLWEW